MGDGALVEGCAHDRTLRPDRPHEHADLSGAHSLPDQLGGLACSCLRLRALGAAAPEAHAAARRAPKALPDPLLDRLDDGPRRREDPPPRAVAALEPDDACVGVAAPEVDQVLRRGTAEAVDRLVVVTDHGHVAVVVGEELEQRRLGEVHVLVLVHEHVAEALGEPRSDVGALVQQSGGLEDQVAEVEPPRGPQQAVVMIVDVGELALAVGVRALGVAGGRKALGVAAEPGRGHGLVLQPVDARDEAAHERRRVAADLMVAKRKLVEVLEQQRHAIGRGDRLERGVQPDLERLVAKEPGAEPMEGGDGELLVGDVDQALEARAHLRRRRGGEREGQDRVGHGTLLHQPEKPARERARLPGPCTRHDEQRAVAVRHRRALRFVEALERARHADLG
jgi:hypothetical protein